MEFNSQPIAASHEEMLRQPYIKELVELIEQKIGEEKSTYSEKLIEIVNA